MKGGKKSYLGKDLLSGGNSEDRSSETGPGQSSFGGGGVVGDFGKSLEGPGLAGAARPWERLGLSEPVSPRVHLSHRTQKWFHLIIFSILPRMRSNSDT